MKKSIITLALMLLSWHIWAQQLSDSTRLYLITCSPGPELFSKFGHSAVRAYDPTTGTDVVFNYGIFDFDTPNFYPKFIRGKLDYMLGVEQTDFFFRVYGSEGREVKQQELRLNPEQSRRVVRFLLRNYEPENRYYRYDFFFDNCATRIRDMLEQEFEYTMTPPANFENSKTFRQLVHEYVSPFPWATFGIDLIFGLPADQEANFRGEMFLPDYLSAHFEKGNLNGTPLVYRVQVMVPERIDHLEPPGNPTPQLVFSMVLFIALLLSWFGSPLARNIMDSILFLTAGLAGSLFVFMWLGTDHVATWQNMDMLWASPFWLLSFFPNKNIKKTGLWIGTLGSTLVLMGFNLLPQEFHVAVIPLALLLILRASDHLFSWMDQIKVMLSPNHNTPKNES